MHYGRATPVCGVWLLLCLGTRHVAAPQSPSYSTWVTSSVHLSPFSPPENTHAELKFGFFRSVLRNKCCCTNQSCLLEELGVDQRGACMASCLSPPLSEANCPVYLHSKGEAGVHFPPWALGFALQIQLNPLLCGTKLNSKLLWMPTEAYFLAVGAVLSTCTFLLP